MFYARLKPKYYIKVEEHTLHVLIHTLTYFKKSLK